MLQETSASRCCDGYDLAMLDLDGVVYIGAARRARAPPSTCAGAREPAAAPGLRHQQRLPDARHGRRAPASSWGSRAEAGDVVTSAQAAAHAAGRPARRRAPRSSCSAARACERRSRRRASSPVTDRDGRPGRRGHRLRPRRAVARRDARRGPDPRRAALGGQQHRPDHPDRRRRSAPGHGVLVRMLRGLLRRRAGGGGQAGAAAVRRDRTPGRRRPPADGRRPARHRHRGRPQRRGRLAAACSPG